MNWLTIIVLLVVVILLAWAFNAFVRMRNIVRTAWSDIDVQLKRRADLIPNIVEATKGYAAHESRVFKETTEARANATNPALSPAQRAAAESEFSQRIGTLLAVAENYPDLKASAQFLRLQAELTETEGKIADARRYYNAAVRDYNTMLESFPLGLMGKATGFKKSEFFSADGDSDRAAPRAEFTT